MKALAAAGVRDLKTSRALATDIVAVAPDVMAPPSAHDASQSPAAQPSS